MFNPYINPRLISIECEIEDLKRRVPNMNKVAQKDARQAIEFWLRVIDGAFQPNTTAIEDRHYICQIGRLFWENDKQCYSAFAVYRKVQKYVKQHEAQPVT